MAAKEPAHYLAVLKASYDYAPQSDDEIAVKEDQILYLVERTDDDWWKVKVKGESQDDEGPTGLVPAAYVEQAQPTSLVKVLYDYDAVAPGELTVKEDQILQLFDNDGDWILAQLNKGDGAGYVPGNYVEAAGGEEEQEESSAPAAGRIVIPDSPPRPASTYIDPADRVASHKITADDIKTWSLSEVDKKGKKKKGTLGIGNGSLFFASESDKAAVQKWQTAHVTDVTSEKAKHVQIEIAGPTPISLHFIAGSKDNAEEIMAKTQSSKAIATAGASPASPETSSSRRLPPARNVHFDDSSPVIIPPPPAEPEVESEDEEQPQDTGEYASVLYDFTADGDDEMSVKEGEQLLILERDGDDWWKCQNADGHTGMVPASYLELASEPQNGTAVAAVPTPSVDHAKAKREEAERRRKEQEREQAEQEERAQQEEQERLQREEEERTRKKREAQEKARAAAAAAEAEREKRKLAAARKAASPPPVSPPPEPKKEATRSSSKQSAELTRPPPDQTRVWHDRTGQFRVEAAFLGFKDGKLRLHKVNGVIVEVPAEKMSVEDMRFVEKVIAKRQRGSNAVTSDDEVPLALTPAAKTSRPTTTPQPPKKGPSIDWFDFFLSAGCDVDDCTRYASAFERDKIDQSILGDLTDGSMRSLGLREGDIIRVKKAIEKRKPTDNLDKPSPYIQDQIKRDEELARQLQEQEQRGGRSGPAPNLFAGPGGTLKTNVRRGRPQPKGSLPLSNVDIKALSDASDVIQRSGSPKSASASATPSIPAVQPPPRSSSAAAPVASGFDDDAWTVRPSSTKPAVETPPAPAPAPAPAPPPAAPPAPVPPPAQPAAPTPAAPLAPPAPSTPSLANTTESDIFQQLERLKGLRNTSSPQQAPSPSAVSPPIVQQANTFPMRSGMGMSHSPVPMGQIPSPTIQTPMNGPRGPYAPVPANQGLLQPLIPTQTGFNSFVPTRAPTFNQTPSPAPQMNNFQQPMGHSMSPPPMMSTPTGMPMNGMNGGGLMPMHTGMPMNNMGNGMGMGMGMNGGGLMSQPTGFPMNNMNNGFGQMPLQNNSGFLQPNPTGFNPSMGSGNFGNFSSAPPVPPLPQQQSKDTSPANVFASMKSGTFEDDSAPRSADMYDPFRNSVQAQPTGWMGGYNQGGMGYR
ncbi:hypothetical protein BKA70DRAFT_559793 [Coprinopsis sp. MPI-PUGE-AT-0042]|nr:hypothetical protein BKA70DRAFT_559793 [Coprinopsis sp. MPI-PUGE-AT-0042]